MDKFKKREKKTLSKTQKNKTDGTVDFTGGSSKDKKGQRKVGDKKPFNKSSGGSKPPFKKFKKEGEKGEVEQTGQNGQKVSNSKIRREKIKVSDLIKKLRINYNKLLMKKKELMEGM
jgi:hypothetical protein